MGKVAVGTNCVRPELSEYGTIIKNEIEALNNIYDDVKVDNYVVMSNHVHMIIIIMAESGRTQFVPTFSRIIKQFKGSITKKIGFSFWQAKFHDHIIRYEEDFLTHRRYIDENPVR